MNHEPNIQDVLDAVSGLSSHMDSEFAGVRSEISEVRADLNEVKADLYVVKTDLNEVKADLNEVKADLQNVKSEVITEIDRFVVLHQTLDVELASLRSRQNRQDNFLVKVADKLELKYEPN
jgi:peptidoglycan hydrolase CwlO-like protein